MTIFQKKKDGNQPQSKLEKRIAGISTPELVTWVENSLYSIGKGVVHYKRDGIEQLYEAELGAEALLAIVRELKKRAEDEF
jgi:hypothetical protein